MKWHVTRCQGGGDPDRTRGKAGYAFTGEIGVFRNNAKRAPTIDNNVRTTNRGSNSSAKKGNWCVGGGDIVSKNV